LGWQRSQSKSQQRKRADRAAQAGAELSTGSFREKLTRKLRRLDLPPSTHKRLTDMIQDDPVAAMKEIKGWEISRKPGQKPSASYRGTRSQTESNASTHHATSAS
jgi:hypothetical protein